MKIYSNIEIPDTLKCRSEQTLIAINKKENPVTSEEDEGRRYEADFTIADKNSESEILEATQRMLHDSTHDDNVIYGFTKEKKIYPAELPLIESSNIIFDAELEKESDTIKALNTDADGNIRKLSGKIKNYVADLTDGVRTSATDSEVEQLVNDDNLVITNE